MVFGLGILWTGLTAAGALSGLLIGFVLGMAKFIVGNVYDSPKCGEVDTRPGFAKMHFMFYGKDLLNSYESQGYTYLSTNTQLISNQMEWFPSFWKKRGQHKLLQLLIVLPNYLPAAL